MDWIIDWDQFEWNLIYYDFVGHWMALDVVGEVIADENEEGEEKSDNSSTKYQLVGVVVHSGQASGGHYFSYILHRLDYPLAPVLSESSSSSFSCSFLHFSFSCAFFSTSSLSFPCSSIFSSFYLPLFISLNPISHCFLPPLIPSVHPLHLPWLSTSGDVSYPLEMAFI